MDIFVAYFLQVLGCERGTSTAAAMANDHCVGVGNFFFDVELDCAATHVSCAWNVSFIPFVLITNINDDRVAAVCFRNGIMRRNLGDMFLRFRDEFLESSVLSHKRFLTTNRHE